MAKKEEKVVEEIQPTEEVKTDVKETKDEVLKEGGDMKVKDTPKKPKQLGKQESTITKVDLSKTKEENVTKEDILDFFTGKVARWWIPDDVVFVSELPHTPTGKVLKTKLREDFSCHVLPTVS